MLVNDWRTVYRRIGGREQIIAILLGSRKVKKREHGSSNDRTGDALFAQKRDDLGDGSSGSGAPRGNGIHGEEENEEQRKIDKKDYRKITKHVQFGGDAILGSLHTSSEFHKAGQRHQIGRN
jgi:hypothetical protein